MDGHVSAHCLTGQGSGGSVIHWAMFCWETWSPAIHMDVTLTCITYLSIVAGNINPFMEMVFLLAVASFSRIMGCTTKKKRFRNGLRSTLTSLRCLFCLQFPQISIQSASGGYIGETSPNHRGSTSQFTGLRRSAVVSVTSWCQILQSIFMEWSPCVSKSELFCPQQGDQHTIQQMVIILCLIGLYVIKAIFKKLWKPLDWWIVTRINWSTNIVQSLS